MHNPCTRPATVLLTCAIALISLATQHSTHAQTDLRWDVETSLYTPVPLEIRRGETLTLTPRFLSYSAPTNIPTNATVQLWYRSADMSNGLYYARTGSILSASAGTVRILWTASACAAATNYTYDIVVSTNNDINLRAGGTIKLLASVYDTGTIVTNPAARTSINWSTTDSTAPESSGFLLDGSASVDGQPLANGATITTVASGITGGTASQIVHNVTDAGFLATTQAINAATQTIDAASLTGTVADAVIASTIARDSEVDAHTQNVTTAHNVDARIAAATGTIAAASLSGTIDNARLSGVTTNNASQINSGTLADARIAATIARDSEVDAHTQNVTTAHNVDARIAAATQTIAGASVSGSVALADGADSGFEVSGGALLVTNSGDTATITLKTRVALGYVAANISAQFQEGLQISSTYGIDLNDNVSFDYWYNPVAIVSGSYGLAPSAQNIVRFDTYALHDSSGSQALLWSDRVLVGDWTVTPTNSFTVTNALQLGGIALAKWSNAVFAVTNAWGFTDPAPTSAIQNVQWAYWANTGTVRGVRGNTLAGTVVADFVYRNWTNASTSFTIAYTGLTFTAVATNVPFTYALVAGNYYGLISTNVTAGTNWTAALEWTP